MRKEMDENGINKLAGSIPEGALVNIVDDLNTEDLEIVPNRDEAISRAVYMAEEGDVIVIAGKGHEDYQIIGTTKLHFDDREIAIKYLKERKAS